MGWDAFVGTPRQTAIRLSHANSGRNAKKREEILMGYGHKSGNADDVQYRSMPINSIECHIHKNIGSHRMLRKNKMTAELALVFRSAIAQPNYF